jgi:hypothetical protein
MTSRRIALSLGLPLLAGLAAVAAPVLAKDAEGRGDHLRWRPDYGEALLEARLRNVPVLVTRHKDECGRCTRMAAAVLHDAEFVRFANEHVVPLVAHNEMLHDQEEAKGADGAVTKRCALYPGLRCRDHVDAAVDVDNARGEDLVAVPFLELCPNTWLVSPTGEVSQVAEEEQFVARKVRARVEALQKTLGEAHPPKALPALKEALAKADAALDADRWKEGLGHLAALATLGTKGKKPHASLETLIRKRLDAVEEDVRFEFEDARDDEKLAPDARRDRIAKLRDEVDVAVLGAKLPVHAETTAWLAR